MASKRTRTGAFIPQQRQARRPIDKNLVAISKGGVDATDNTTVLITATFPCTIVGMRWDFTTFQAAGTGTAVAHWAIVLQKDGATLGTLAISDAAAFYEPEQECLSFGVSCIDNNVESVRFNGSTKTMRKLMGGDRLVFIVKGTATDTTSLRGVIQFFCKT